MPEAHPLSSYVACLLCPQVFAFVHSFKWTWVGGKNYTAPPGFGDLSAVVLGSRVWKQVVPSPYRGQIELEQECSIHGWSRRERPAIVIDAVLFHNELDLLEARFYELYEWVDSFLIVEIGTTYTGRSRPSEFANCLVSQGCADRFMPFLNKVNFWFFASLPGCQTGYAWDCEFAHRHALTDAFLSADGRDEVVVMMSDADEFARAAGAWALKNCAAPDKVHFYPSFYYFSAHCHFSQPQFSRGNSGTRAVSGRIMKSKGAQWVRTGWPRKGHHPDEGWVSLENYAYHFAYFMHPSEIVLKLSSFSHHEFNVLPFTTQAWQLDNARSCTFSVSWLHSSGNYVKTEDLVYPRIPWYAVENKTAMWRFYQYERDKGSEDEIESSNGTSVAVCITGQIRGTVHWYDVRAVARAGASVDSFAAVPSAECSWAERDVGLQSQGFVQCVEDYPLSAEEQLFVDYGPHVDFNLKDHRLAHVFQYRLVAACSELIDARERFNQRKYDWVLRKRADVFLREFPSFGSLNDKAIFCAYRDKDMNFGGLNDKLLLGRPREMRHVHEFHKFFTDVASWPTWRWLGATSTFGGRLGWSFERFHVSNLANVTGPAEALLQSYLMVRGVSVRAIRSLRYDLVGRWSEVSSPEPFLGQTGSFNVHLNPDNLSNAFPREPYFVAPIVSLIVQDQNTLGRKVVIMDCGCGSGYLTAQLERWSFIVFGIDLHDSYKARLGANGIQADLSVLFDAQPEVAAACGLMKNRALGLDMGSLKTAVADWVLAIDVGSYIPPVHRHTFLSNVLGYAGRGLVLRWGLGPHQVAESVLRTSLENGGFVRQHEHERYFALFAGLMGPNKGSVMVYVRGDDRPLPTRASPTSAMFTGVDLFESNHNAAHFAQGDEVWREGELETTISYLRFWKALLRPNEGRLVLAALRYPIGKKQAGIAWGSVTWEQLACSSWDFAEIFRLIQERNASLLAPFVTRRGIHELAELRKAIARGKGGRRSIKYKESRCTRNVRRFSSLLSGVTPNFLNVAQSLAGTFLGSSASPGRPAGLHRQAWLNRLATRFWSG